MYPIILCIISWCTGETYTYHTESTFKSFSQSYCAFVLFPVLVYLCSKKDLSIFMKVGSIGVIFIVFLMFFIIYVGVNGLTNTEYKWGTMAESDNSIWEDPQRTLVLFNLNFAPLAGDLCTGYFLHTCSLPVLRSSKNPEKSIRDLFLGYLLVYISYSVVGVFGYIGFIGTNYSQYYINEMGTNLAGQIN
jgi:amino acid permease